MINQEKYILTLVLILSCSIAQDPVVNLPQGRVVGTKVYSEKLLTPIEVYYGIPYAIPPIGRYRFAAPEPHTGWRRTFYAHRIPPRCPDFNVVQSDNNYSEDCLFVNIWTPRPADRKPLPVVIILYTESWLKAGVPLPCQDMAAEGLIVVTVGYRLNLLGFFNLGTIAARGNLPLLDQYLALLWVRDNIASFGGDASYITILGQSAGADSLLYHIASPRTRGLFERAIILSPRDLWKIIDDQAVVTSNETQKASREIAFFLGCSSKVDQEILHCMRSRPLTDLMSLYSKNVNWVQLMQPVSDNYLPESEQYLPTSLYGAVSNKKTIQLELLLGIADLDEFNYGDENHHMTFNATKLLDFIDTKTIPQLLKRFSLDIPKILPILTSAIRWEYWNKGYKFKNNVEDLLEYLDRIESSAKCGAGFALFAARLARVVSRLYAYRYSIPSTFDLYGKHYNGINVTGAIHGSDLIYLLGDALMVQVTRRPPTTNEQLISSLFRQYIVQFIKYGKPRDNWQHYEAGDAHIYKIMKNLDTLKVVEDNNNREAEFWLHYLPAITSHFEDFGETGKFITQEREEGRLRGGVFAMCGVAVVLLVLLFISAVILKRQRSSRRFSVSDDSQNK